MMQTIDFSVRPDWLEDIRKTEVNQLLQIWKNIAIPTNKILDLGCGTNKYLKTILGINGDRYIGLDIVGSPDIKMDIKDFPMNILNQYFVISFGLLVYLTDDLKRKILNNVNHCLIQVNRNDTNISKKIDEFDLSQGLQRFGINTDFIMTLNNTFKIYENNVCFFLVK